MKTVILTTLNLYVRRYREVSAINSPSQTLHLDELLDLSINQKIRSTVVKVRCPEKSKSPIVERRSPAITRLDSIYHTMQNNETFTWAKFQK